VLYLQPLRMVVECRPRDGVKFPGAWNEAHATVEKLGTPVLLRWADRYVLVDVNSDMVSDWQTVISEATDE